MREEAEHICFVCSADADCCRRIDRLIARSGGWAVVPLDDPVRLRPSLRDARATRVDQIALVLDLTFPGESADMAGSTASTWQVAALVALSMGAPDVPTLVVTTFAPLASVLAAQGIPLTAQVAPRDDDATWRHAIAQVLASHPAQSDVGIGDEAHMAREARSTRVTLRGEPPLHWDVSAGTLTEHGQTIQLTPREQALLGILVNAPGRTFSARALARLVTRPDDNYAVGAHAVVQSLAGLRRKLGDDTAETPLLINRRGFGYTLVRQVSPTAVMPTRTGARRAQDR